MLQNKQEQCSVSIKNENWFLKVEFLIIAIKKNTFYNEENNSTVQKVQ
jgi:hypothetical protein